ncbi:MAG: multiprotein-bridging factor 1 family protein [Parachlamydiaceae bacterium]
MLGHTKGHPTKARCSDFPVKIVIIAPAYKREAFINFESMGKLEAFLNKYSEDEAKPVAWDNLAKKRIEKYKKAGLVLRGMRYREGLSQVDLAKKSGVHQNEISKIENGKRTLGAKVAKKLALALNMDYRLFVA